MRIVCLADKSHKMSRLASSEKLSRNVFVKHYTLNYMLIHTKCQLERAITLKKFIRFLSKINQVTYLSSPVSSLGFKALLQKVFEWGLLLTKKHDIWTNRQAQSDMPSGVGAVGGIKKSKLLSAAVVIGALRINNGIS